MVDAQAKLSLHWGYMALCWCFVKQLIYNLKEAMNVCKQCRPVRVLEELNPIALIKAKIVYNFGLFECSRVHSIIILVQCHA